MTTRKSTKVCKCGKPSLPGLRRGVALCQYHFNALVWGKEWADEVEWRAAAERKGGKP